MDDRRRTPSDGKSSHCLWQGELKMGVHESIMTILDGDQIFLLTDNQCCCFTTLMRIFLFKAAWSLSGFDRMIAGSTEISTF